MAEGAALEMRKVGQPARGFDSPHLRDRLLKQLKAGLIRFNSVATYRDDGTAYYGDENKGGIPIDPLSISIRDNDGIWRFCFFI